MLRRILSILILIGILSTSFPAVIVHAESNLTTKLKENFIPLKTVEAENGFEDLMPLKEILKDKKVIGIGEATHGTKEFFQMKHRMFEFLVEEMGYRVFAMETSFGGAQVVNDYILNDLGSIDEAIKALKWSFWMTEEVVAMVEWMKNYNENPENKDKIKFYGFDMQSIDKDIKHILEYIEKVDSNDKEKHLLRLLRLKDFLANPKGEELIKFKNNIGDVSLDLNNNKEDYISKSSEKEYELILQHISVVYQWIDFNMNDSSDDNRDRYMAKNAKWILDHETKYNKNDKIMLWAHNGHISKKRSFISMGENLSTIFDTEYYAIGFDFYKGVFKALPVKYSGKRILKSYDLASFVLSNTPKGSTAYEFEKTDISLGYLDFNSSKEDKDILEFLSSRKTMNYIGATYRGRYYKATYLAKGIPLEQYDGIIFIKETSAFVAYLYKTPFYDGDKIIADYYKILGVFFIILLLIWIKIYLSRKNKNKNKVVLIDEETINRKVDSLISTKDGEEAKGIERKLIELHKYASSLSTIKYIFMTIILLLVVSAVEYILYNILPLEIVGIEQKALYLGDHFLEYTISMIGSSIIGIFIYNVLAFKIFRHFSKEKLIKISHIVLLSIVLGGIQYFISKSVMFAITGVISSFIMNYSYVLYFYKDKKPFLIVSLITILHGIAFNLLSLIIYSIFN